MCLYDADLTLETYIFKILPCLGDKKRESNHI